MNILGVFMEGPNTGACLVQGGQLVAMAEEERFTRVKRASESFPEKAIRYCLEQGGTSLGDTEALAVAWDHAKYPEKMNAYMKSIPDRELDPYADTFEWSSHLRLSEMAARFKIQTGLRRIDPKASCEITFYSHHYCHAASVHHFSGFERSSVLVMDGSGEEIATSMWLGDGDAIQLLEEYKLPHSLGWYYAAITEYLGFEAYDGEGKVMGLAPYGSPNAEVAAKLRRFCQPDKEHAYSIDPTYVYYGQRTYSRRFTDKLVDLLGSPRPPGAELTPYYESIAFEAQKLLEEIATALTLKLLARTGVRNLCVSGGVAMNCKMNGILSGIDGVDDIFINPASHDSGAAMGAAILAHCDRGGNPRQNRLTHAFWGPEFTDEEIESVLRHCQLSYRRSESISADCAALLADGKIVGWFQGRAEIGARALGGRSILANPLIREMKDVINARVKYREGFRPFAPSMIEEVKHRYMVEPKDSPFMILAYPVREEFREVFPAVVHVDGSVRPQTVSKRDHPLFWQMLTAFGERTGHPVVLNTSFNVRGEPIVNTPLDAVRCYFSTGMDALSIGNYLLEKDVGRAVRNPGLKE